MLIELDRNYFKVLNNSKLTEKDNFLFYFEGYFFYNAEFYDANNAINLLYNFLNNIDNIIQNLNGVFVCLSLDKSKNKVTIFNDKISFPAICYAKKDSKFYFSENFFEIANYLDMKELDEVSALEFLKYRFVSGKYTLLKDIYEIQPGRIYSFENNEINEKVWYEYQIKEKINNKDYAEKAIFNSMEKIFKRYDKIFENKKIGLNLTGGLDSRYILGMLLKHDYKNNLTTFTFGTKYCEEIEIAELINKRFNLKARYYYLDKDFINEYYDKTLLLDIINAIGYKTYYFQGYGFSKLSKLHREENIDYLLTGDNGFILGLLYKDSLENITSYEELASNLSISSSTMLSDMNIKKYTFLSINNEIKERLYERIYKQLNKSNDFVSEYVKWSILNRERNYATRNYAFYSFSSTPLYPNYDNEFFELMFNLSKTLFKDQRVYINSMYKYLFINELKFLSQIPVEQRDTILKTKNNDFVFNSKFYKLKREILDKVANKFNLKSKYNSYPFNLIKKNKKLVYNKIKHIIDNENIINKDYLLKNLFGQKRKFYLYDLAVLISLESFMNYVKEEL